MNIWGAKVGFLLGDNFGLLETPPDTAVVHRVILGMVYSGIVNLYAEPSNGSTN